jgi:hypothetical protein
VDKATDVVRDAHLITYIRYVLENDVKENCLFCRCADGRAVSLEVFNIINTFLEESEI